MKSRVIFNEDLFREFTLKFTLVDWDSPFFTNAECHKSKILRDRREVIRKVEASEALELLLLSQVSSI